jgi:hypothetical protein
MTLTKNRGARPSTFRGTPSNSHSGTHPLLPLPAKASAHLRAIIDLAAPVSAKKATQE